MRIAVIYENGNVFQHFGHTQQFKIYDVENSKITNEQVIDTGESGHGALVGLLSEISTDVLICGGIGGGAKQALADARITLYSGVNGGADEAVKAYLNGHLKYNPNTQCEHHSHGEHDSCGEDQHGCSGGSCSI